jgi:hypothetical protein
VSNVTSLPLLDIRLRSPAEELIQQLNAFAEADNDSRGYIFVSDSILYEDAALMRFIESEMLAYSQLALSGLNEHIIQNIPRLQELTDMVASLAEQINAF